MFRIIIFLVLSALVAENAFAGRGRGFGHSHATTTRAVETTVVTKVTGSSPIMGDTFLVIPMSLIRNNEYGSIVICDFSNRGAQNKKECAVNGNIGTGEELTIPQYLKARFPAAKTLRHVKMEYRGNSHNAELLLHLKY